MQKIVVDFDDFCDESNRLDLLFRIKAKVPNFKCTLFTIPVYTSLTFAEQVSKLGWLELAFHGDFHTTQECKTWSNMQVQAYVDKWCRNKFFVKVFKAPHWAGNEVVYKYLTNAGFIIAENKETPFKNVYQLNNGKVKSVHGHIPDVCGNGIASMYDDVCSLKGEFYFISELPKAGLI
jgi:hypothetical protein